jgi:DNA-binding NarL/FixJ family response regulator
VDPADAEPAVTRPRILIADDHALVAAGLRAMLEPLYEVVEVISSGLDVVSAVERLSPDLVLLDISLPGRSGMEVARDLSDHPSRVRFLILTMHADPLYADEALALGARGFVPKLAGPEELRHAIAKVLKGEVYVSPQLDARRRTPVAPADPDDDHGWATLTDRQREILVLIAKGWSTRDIGHELGINVRSVEFHRDRIRRALGLTSTAALVRYAITRGLVHH